MKQLLIIALTLILSSLSTTALADRDHRYDGYSGRYDRGDRIDHRLDRKGDRLERHFDRRADRAAERGHYRQAYHLKEKGQWLNPRFDRKGDRFERRYERRSHDYRHHNKHRSGGYLAHDRRYGDRLHLGVFVPGFWFSGIWHD